MVGIAEIGTGGDLVDEHSVFHNWDGTHTLVVGALVPSLLKFSAITASTHSMEQRDTNTR